MDLRAALDILHKGTAIADNISPLLSAFGVPQAANVIKIVETLTKLAETVLLRIEEGRIVATSTQKAELEAIIANLQARNDALAKVIAGS